MSALLREVISLSQPELDDAGVKVCLNATDSPCEVKADPEQMQQLFGNLVLNALQAMPNGGALTVTARPLGGGRTGSRVEMRVEDTGTGIPEADLPRIFEPFYTTRSKGTGLGLNLVKQIVEKVHSGRVFVSSKVGAGSTFGFELPLAAAEMAVV
jgi:signal transduction histidine kinase